MELLGVEALQAAFDAMIVTAATAARTIVKRAEVEVEAETKKSFTGAHGKGTRTTSRPGTPPDVVTGALRRSITSSAVQVTGTTATGSVYPAAIYARIQELGGFGGGASHLPARPYLAPSLEKAIPRIQAIAAEEWIKA